VKNTIYTPKPILDERQVSIFVASSAQGHRGTFCGTPASPKSPATPALIILRPRPKRDSIL
jgi:hypothetical protein